MFLQLLDRCVVFSFDTVFPQLDGVITCYCISLCGNGVLNSCQQVNEVGLLKIGLPGNSGHLKFRKLNQQRLLSNVYFFINLKKKFSLRFILGIYFRPTKL